MTIILTHDQEAWLKVQVERGEFTSVEDAARQLLDERIAERSAEDGDDFAWAKIFVQEAELALARGEVISRQEHQTRNDARLGNREG